MSTRFQTTTNLPTPSKAVSLLTLPSVVASDPLQAAAALANIKLESPVKKVIDDSKRSVSPDSVVDEREVLAELRKKYVGEVDLPESTSCFSSRHAHPNGHLGEEPLLKESRRRFVLFPIQYHEVSRRVLDPVVVY